MTSTTLLTGPCPGDSRSAALQDGNVVALVSRGFEPCGLGVGGVVMTSLGPHAEWVHKTAALV